jgi:hypothetical protein
MFSLEKNARNLLAALDNLPQIHLADHAIAEHVAALRGNLDDQTRWRTEQAAAIALARKQTDNELEIDDVPFVSPDTEGKTGCWVSGWVWADAIDVEAQE